MWDLREASNGVESQFARAFLNLQPEELRLLFGVCVDEVFSNKHPKLAGYLFKALRYRENQYNTNCEDACSVQDLFIEQWTPDELFSGVIGLERIYVLAEDKPKIISYLHYFNLLLVEHVLGRWLGSEDRKNAT